MRTCWSCALLIALVACVSPSTNTGDGPRFSFPEFPDQAEIDLLVRGFPIAYESAEPGVLVDEWTLLGPLPSEYAKRSRSTSLEPLMASIATARPEVEPNQALTCLAREIDHFISSQSERPQRGLAHFMAARCGWSSPEVSWERFMWPADTPPSEIEAKIAALISSNTQAFGLWHTQTDDTHRVFLTQGRFLARLDALSMMPDGQVVELRGKVDEHEWLQGFVTQGKYGANTCRNMPTAGNAFRVLCPVDTRDRGAVIEISAADPGRLLGGPILRVWVSPDGKLSKTYERLELYSAPAPIPAQADLDAIFLETVNELRAALDYGKLERAEAQSAEFQRVFPHFESALASSNEARAEMLMLGLLAGWKLPVPVLSGDIGIFLLEAPRDRRDLIEAALASPHRRYALLDPARTLFAFGALGEAGQTREVLVGTWQPLPNEHQRAAEDWFSLLVEATRKLEGLPETLHVGGELHDILARHGSDLATSEAYTPSIMHETLGDISSSEKIPIRGLWIFTQDIHELAVPEELLRADVLQLAVHVQVVADESSRWGRLAVMMAYVYEDDLR
jgi:hypothetical protein